MSATELPARYAEVHRLASELRFDEAALRRAADLAGLAPGPARWRRMLDAFFMGVGVLLIVAGVAAFFAWNWADLGRFAKFGLIEGGVAAVVALACWRGLDTVAGRALLLGSAGLVGVLLAYFGQTYQTGADPYGLFLGWLLLVLPWALVGRQAGLWALLLLLANLAVVMYWTQVLHPPEGMWQLTTLLGPLVWLGLTVMDSELASLLFALNAVALFAWEWLAARPGFAWMRGRWLPRFAASVALATVVAPTVAVIFVASFGERLSLSLLSPLLFVAATGAGLAWYRYRRLDLYILTGCLAGAIMVVTSLVIRYLLADAGSLLLIALLLIGEVAAASTWLRRVAGRGRSGDP